MRCFNTRSHIVSRVLHYCVCAQLHFSVTVACRKRSNTNLSHLLSTLEWMYRYLAFNCPCNAEDLFCISAAFFSWYFDDAGGVFFTSCPFSRGPSNCDWTGNAYDSVSCFACYSFHAWFHLNFGYGELLVFGSQSIFKLAASDEKPSLTLRSSSYMFASLSLNPESFSRRFAVVPCAAGSSFQAVDVMMNTPTHVSNFDWGSMFVKPSQQSSFDHEDANGNENITRCKNCRLAASLRERALKFCNFELMISS